MDRPTENTCLARQSKLKGCINLVYNQNYVFDLMSRRTDNAISSRQLKDRIGVLSYVEALSLTLTPDERDILDYEAAWRRWHKMGDEHPVYSYNAKFKKFYTRKEFDRILWIISLKFEAADIAGIDIGDCDQMRFQEEF